MQPKEETIRKMIDIEWPMFRDVNGDGPKASCQNDRRTFEGMRRGQYEAWDEKTCESYLRDLENAVRQGRNLPTEKYIRMMRSTAPQDYEKLKFMLPPADPRAIELADRITEKIVAQTVVLHERYPRVSGAGRPLYASQDGPGVELPIHADIMDATWFVDNRFVGRFNQEERMRFAPGRHHIIAVSPNGGIDSSSVSFTVTDAL